MSNSNNKVFDFVAYEIEVDKIIKRSFSTSYMSNSKWRKCFQILDSATPDLQVIWKFVGSKNQGVRNYLPSKFSLEEEYLSSEFGFGPRYYKEIECLEFPSVGKPNGKEDIPAAFFGQDINAAAEALNEMGQWPIYETELGFRLYGYHRNDRQDSQ